MLRHFYLIKTAKKSAKNNSWLFIWACSINFFNDYVAMLANLSMLHYSGPESNTCNFTFSPQKTFHRLPPALFGSLTYLMIVILHYPLKKISPAPAGITWWSNTCNFTFSPQKKFDRLPPAFFGDLMIVILHYPQKKFSPADAGIIWSSNYCNFTFCSAKKNLVDKMWSLLSYTLSTPDFFTPPPSKRGVGGSGGLAPPWPPSEN